MHPLSLPKVYYAFVQGSVCVRVCWDWMEDILKHALRACMRVSIARDSPFS